MEICFPFEPRPRNTGKNNKHKKRWMKGKNVHNDQGCINKVGYSRCAPMYGKCPEHRQIKTSYEVTLDSLTLVSDVI